MGQRDMGVQKGPLQPSSHGQGETQSPVPWTWSLKLSPRMFLGLKLCPRYLNALNGLPLFDRGLMTSQASPEPVPSWDWQALLQTQGPHWFPTIARHEPSEGQEVTSGQNAGLCSPNLGTTS